MPPKLQPARSGKPLSNETINSISNPWLDGIMSLPSELKLVTEAHVKYIQSLDTKKDEYAYWLTEHLRMGGLYWGLTALHLLGRPDALPRDATIDFVLSCQHESGGFGAAPGHDAHMLSTVSAVQVLALVDALDELDARGKGKAKVGQCTSCLDVIDELEP